MNYLNFQTLSFHHYVELNSSSLSKNYSFQRMCIYILKYGAGFESFGSWLSSVMYQELHAECLQGLKTDQCLWMYLDVFVFIFVENQYQNQLLFNKIFYNLYVIVESSLLTNNHIWLRFVYSLLYLISFKSKEVHHSLRSISHQNIKNSITLPPNDFDFSDWDFTDFNLFLLKKLTANNCKYLGILKNKLVSVLVENLETNSSQEYIVYFTRGYYVLARKASVLDKDYELARTYYFKALFSGKIRTHFDICYLIGLSWNCYFNAEYLIGMRLLRFAWIQTNGKYLVNYVNRNWSKLMPKFRKKWRNSTCNNCKIKDINTTLKACRGCQRVYYCSRRCQKNSWKTTHRYECGKHWYQDHIRTVITKPLSMTGKSDKYAYVEDLMQKGEGYLPCNTELCRSTVRAVLVKILKC